MKMLKETYTLNNGVEIPKIGLGTWQMHDEKIRNAISAAFELGYRHIDTAEAYGNEKEVGEAVRASGLPREEIFVTTKVLAKVKDYEEARKCIEDSLAALDIGYIDLMIIHCPQPWDEYNRSENRYKEGNVAVYKALEEFYKAGRIRAIGVSNFREEDIENILENCEVVPAVDQILCHISNTPHSLIGYCQKKGIQIEAYSPIAHGEILQNKAIAEMAEKYGVSVAQLCVRYCLQLGAVALPKASSKVHLAENADTDFVISEEDMEVLKNFEKIKDYGESSRFPAFGGSRPEY